MRRIDSAVGSDCAAVSHGRTRTYFAAHPCVAVGRALFEVRANGVRVFVAVAVVDMPTDDDGIALKRLVDTYGTGNISELRASRGCRRPGMRPPADATEGRTRTATGLGLHSGDLDALSGR